MIIAIDPPSTTPCTVCIRYLVGMPSIALIRSGGLLFVRAANEGRTVIEMYPRERITADFEGLQMHKAVRDVTRLRDILIVAGSGPLPLTPSGGLPGLSAEFPPAREVYEANTRMAAERVRRGDQVRAGQRDAQHLPRFGARGRHPRFGEDVFAGPERRDRHRRLLGPRARDDQRTRRRRHPAPRCGR